MQYNSLGRDNFAKMLEEKGCLVDYVNIKGEDHNTKLCSLFWQKFKASLNEKSENVQIHYAEMLEVIRTFMIKNKMKIKEIEYNNNQPLLWYKEFASSEQKLAEARINLVQRFNEFLMIRTEAIKDQIKDVFTSFTALLEAHNIDLNAFFKWTTDLYKKSGSYTKGVYINTISRVKVQDKSL